MTWCRAYGKIYSERGEQQKDGSEISEKGGSQVKGTVRAMKQIGYTDEQSQLMGDIDDLFEQAIKVGLVSDKDAIVVGQVVGTMALHHTGKQEYMNGVQVEVFVDHRQVL